ncbi:MAG: hypothetical protein E6J77_00675 [Deltaproteobacteria bacterium]|nr:MAG: hypothetical protein E6J77_00675 [Deltaproteobacteria bacterium]
MLRLSTLVAHPEPPTYYARSKRAFEGILQLDRDLIVRPGLSSRGKVTGSSSRCGMPPGARTRFLSSTAGGSRYRPSTSKTPARRSRERDLTGALNVAEPDPVPVGTFLRRMTEGLGVRCLFLPLPFAPVLAMLRVIEALRLPFPLRSESLLGLKALRQVPVADDLRWLGLRAGTAEQSLADLL